MRGSTASRLGRRDLPRWELRVDGEPRHGSHALVVPVTSADGLAALRLTRPGQRAEDDLRALRFWVGSPVVGVLRATEDAAAMLLERLDAGQAALRTPSRRGRRRARRPGARTLAAMSRPRPACRARRTRRATVVEQGRRRWHALGSPFVPADVLGTAVGTGGTTSCPANLDLAVNGDLHADQVLQDAAGEWRVVDPLLMRGDPSYDLARDRVDDDRPAAGRRTRSGVSPTGWWARPVWTGPEPGLAGSYAPSATGCGASRPG